MKEIRKNGYIAGIISSLISVIFLIVIINSGWDLTGQVLTVFTVLFGSLGIGSFLKPESIGQITSKILENIGRNTQEQNIVERSNVSKSNVVQISADNSQGSNIILNINSKESQIHKLKDKLKETLENIDKSPITVDKSPIDYLIENLRKEIIQKINELSISDLLLKTLALANLKTDKETIGWITKELNGYRDSTDLPEYRFIMAKMDIVLIFSNNEMMDLRKHPIKIGLSSPIDSFWDIYVKKADALIYAPPPPILTEFFKKFKIKVEASNIDYQNNIPYVIYNKEINSLINGLKERIVNYVSRIG